TARSPRRQALVQPAEMVTEHVVHVVDRRLARDDVAEHRLDLRSVARHQSGEVIRPRLSHRGTSRVSVEDAGGRGYCPSWSSPSSKYSSLYVPRSRPWYTDTTKSSRGTSAVRTSSSSACSIRSRTSSSSSSRSTTSVP